jgi:hypothetical protein
LFKKFFILIDLKKEDRMGDIRKNIEKKKKKRKECPELDAIDDELQKTLDSLKKPSISQMLPYRFSVWLFYLLASIPSLINEKIKSKRSDNIQNDSGNESEDERDALRAQKMAQNDRLQRNLNPKNIEKSKISAVVSTVTSNSTVDSNLQKINTKKEWSDKEKTNLIKAITRFPPGTTSRWNKISEFVETRTPADCIQMEKHMKTNITSSLNSHLNANTWSQLSSNVEKDANDNITSTKDDWSQDQQDLFEKALKQVNKDELNRWEKIAEFVPDKNKVIIEKITYFNKEMMLIYYFYCLI